MLPKRIQLKPIIKEHAELFEDIENKIIEVFQREIYRPLAHALVMQMRVRRRKICNSEQTLKEAIDAGRITYSRGAFRGKFNTSITKELKKIGAVWDAKTSSFKIKKEKIPYAFQIVVASSRINYSRKLAVLDKVLSKIDIEKISGKIFIENPIKATIDKVEETFQSSMRDFSKKAAIQKQKDIEIEKPAMPYQSPIPERFHSKKTFENPYDAIMKKVLDYSQTPQGITVSPKLTLDQRTEIISEYQDNIKRSIKGFSQEQIKSLRQRIELSARAGNRYESLVKGIQTEYGISASKARFIARQETNLFLAAFKKARYTSAGSETYIWGCVKRPHDTSPDHHTLGNVRYYHGILEGTVQRWDSPPITDGKGNRNNPLEDFGCRCYSLPLIDF